jgi:hypothetical protein
MKRTDYLICPQCGIRATSISALFGEVERYGQLGKSVEKSEGVTSCSGCRKEITILKVVSTTYRVKRDPKVKVKPDPETFYMTLRSVGNPDFGQYSPVSPIEKCEGKTLLEMRQKAEAYIRKWELGGGNFVDPKVFMGDKFVGRFSYNGRLWPSRKYDPLEKEIEIDSWDATKFGPPKIKRKAKK